MYTDGRGRRVHEKIHKLIETLKIYQTGFIYTSEPDRLEVKGNSHQWMVSYSTKKGWKLETNDGRTAITFINTYPSHQIADFCLSATVQ